MHDEYIIDKTVSLLIQRKTEKDYKELERSIIENGAFSNITVWNQYVIDGLECFEICKKNMVEFRTYKIGFDSWPHVYSWICGRQLDREDLDPMRVKFLLGFLGIAEEAIGKGRNELKGPPYKMDASISIISKTYKLSAPCISNYEFMAYRIFTINRYNTELADYILNGHLKISLSNIADLAKKQPDDYDRLVQLIKERSTESEIRYIDLCPSLGWKPVPAHSMNRKDKTKIPEIRKMPTYDPDAELRSLSFTVPMWTSAIKRMIGSDNSHASLFAKNQLYDSLAELISSSQHLQDELKRGHMND